MAVSKLISRNGELRFFTSPVAPGIMIDADGRDAFMQQVGQYLMDIRSGELYDWSQYLIENSDMAGLDLTVANVRTGARKPVDDSVTTEVAADTPDLSIVNGIYTYGSMVGATNLVGTIPENWASYSTFGGANIVTVDGVSTLTMTADGLLGAIDLYTEDSNAKTLSFEARLVSGTVPDAINHRLGFFSGALVKENIRLATIPSTWTKFEIKHPAGETTNAVRISAGDLSAVYVIEFRNIRAIDDDMAYAAFPDGSAPAAAYGTDSLTVDIPAGFPSPGGIAFWVNRYDVDSTARSMIYVLGNGFNVGFNSSGNPIINQGFDTLTATETVGREEKTVILAEWDGVKWYLTVGTGTTHELVKSTVPTGTSFRLGRNFASNILHGAVAALVYDGIASAEQKAAWNSGLQSRLSGVTFR